MLTFRKIVDFYIQSSIHVGFAVFCLVQLSVQQWSSYSFLVLFGTIVGYNLLKYSEWFFSTPFFRIQYIGILVVTLFSTLGFFWFLLQQNTTVQLHMLFAFGLVVLYPFIRKIGWLKPFYVSFVVSYITLFIPLKSDVDVIGLFVQRFLLLSIVMIPFEILDSSKDAVAMKTLPHCFGIARTKQIGYVLVGLFLTVSLFLRDNIYFFAFAALSSLIAIYFSNEKRSWYYTSFWVESLPIFWLVVLLFS
jgi:hypothetical protein